MVSSSTSIVGNGNVAGVMLDWLTNVLIRLHYYIIAVFTTELIVGTSDVKF